MKRRLCICGCNRHFPLTRADRIHYEKSCRNKMQRLNETNRLAEIEELLPKAKEMDIRLQKMLENESKMAFIEVAQLEQYGIEPAYALEILKNDQGKLIRAAFYEYEIFKVTDVFFIVKRIVI